MTPSVFTDGGSPRYQKRTFGRAIDGGDWRGGPSSVSFRVELSWALGDGITLFAYVEQYDVAGGDHRRTNAASGYRCAHNDWTHGGIGIRARF